MNKYLNFSDLCLYSTNKLNQLVILGNTCIAHLQKKAVSFTTVNSLKTGTPVRRTPSFLQLLAGRSGRISVVPSLQFSIRGAARSGPEGVWLTQYTKFTVRPFFRRLFILVILTFKPWKSLRTLAAAYHSWERYLQLLPSSVSSEFSSASCTSMECIYANDNTISIKLGCLIRT